VKDPKRVPNTTLFWGHRKCDMWANQTLWGNDGLRGKKAQRAPELSDGIIQERQELALE